MYVCSVQLHVENLDLSVLIAAAVVVVIFPVINTSLLHGHKPFKGEKQSQYLATSPLDVLFFTEMRCYE